MAALDAVSLYGATPVVEGSQTGIAEHAASGSPEPNRQVAARKPGIGNPVVVLMVLLALAFFLINVDLRFSAAVQA